MSLKQIILNDCSLEGEKIKVISWLLRNSDFSLEKLKSQKLSELKRLKRAFKARNILVKAINEAGGLFDKVQ